MKTEAQGGIGQEVFWHRTLRGLSCHASQSPHTQADRSLNVLSGTVLKDVTLQAFEKWSSEKGEMK